MWQEAIQKEIIENKIKIAGSGIARVCEQSQSPKMRKYGQRNAKKFTSPSSSASVLYLRLKCVASFQAP